MNWYIVHAERRLILALALTLTLILAIVIAIAISIVTSLPQLLAQPHHGQY